MKRVMFSILLIVFVITGAYLQNRQQTLANYRKRKKAQYFLPFSINNV